MRDENKLTITNLIIICISAILTVVAICVVIILIAINNSQNTPAETGDAETTKREDIAVQVDGLSFTVKEKFGDTVRQIAKQRQPYWFDTQDAKDTVRVNDLESFLNQPYKNIRTQIEFKNRSNTYYNVNVFYENDGIKHDSSYKIGDAKANVDFNVRDYEIAYIDNLKIQANTTTKEDLRSMFKDIKIQENNSVADFATHIAQYKGYTISFSYQNGIIAITIRSK